MKQTKRSIMIPEDHYVQLTKLISGNDSVHVEKVKNDQQIQNILTSRLTDVVKNVRYNLLAKNRKKLNQILAKRPTAVVDSIVKGLMKELSEDPSKVDDASVTGIVPATDPHRNLQQIQKEHVHVPALKPRPKVDLSLEEEESDGAIFESDEEDKPLEKKKPSEPLALIKKMAKVKTYHGKINKKYYENLKDYLLSEKSRKKYGISKTGHIYTNVSEAKAGYGKQFPGSNVEAVLKIYAGMEDVPRDMEKLTCASAFLPRLAKDPTVTRMINDEYTDQRGEGSKNVYVLDMRKDKTQKVEQTKGLIRKRINNRIKPLLWTKIKV